MIFNNLKIFCLTFLLCPFTMDAYTQITSPNTVEEKAFKYFCDQVLLQETRINQFRIWFDGSTNGKPSKIYDVANCLKHINLLKDSIPNKAYLDSIEQKYAQTKSNIIKISTPCKRFSKQTLFKKNGYRLYLYNAIEYNGNYCVEFLLANKKNSTYTIIVTLDKNLLVPLNHCIKAITYY
jgi:hypothetical protein